MITMTKKKDASVVENFVRRVLGCGCPEEVFRSVDRRRDVVIDEGLVVLERINVGNRLLIYVVEADETAFLDRHLGRLVASGRDERDRNGFNRFRLVIATGRPEEMEDIARKIFEGLESRDERVHLHMIPKSEMLPLLSTAP